MGNAGIDYGLGKTNIDLETGIRYGVIALNNCNPDWLNEFEPYYGEESIELDDYAEPISWSYDRDGIKAEYSADGSWLFVFKSPVVVRCNYCSPCVPGAGDLDNPNPEGIEAYGLPNDCLWSEE